MVQIVIWVVGVGFCTFWLWLMVSPSANSAGSVPSLDDVIDPNNSYQIGYLLGMAGGSVTDASIARYALQRFEQTYGYKPSLRDAAVVVGLMNGAQSLSWDSDSRSS